MQSIKGARGVALAFSRPRWGIVAGVAGVSFFALWNAHRIHDAESTFSQLGPYGTAFGSLSAALVAGITTPRRGEQTISTVEAAFGYFLGALALSIPFALLSIAATAIIGGSMPTADDVRAGALIAGAVQVNALIAFAAVRGVRVDGTDSGGIHNGSDNARWD